MLEKLIIQHGAPTLAGLKTGNLFSVPISNREEAERETERINKILEPKGVKMTVMKHENDRTMLYLYRPEQLRQCLQCPNTKGLLENNGYEDHSVEGALQLLREKLQGNDAFPHEIGIFLGYPLSDVAGFINHGGKNCLLCGCWKVYDKEADAMKTFAQYKKCKKIYTRLYHTGYSLSKLTVAKRAA